MPMRLQMASAVFLLSPVIMITLNTINIGPVTLLFNEKKFCNFLNGNKLRCFLLFYKNVNICLE